MIFNRKFAQDMNKQFNWDSPTDIEFFGQAAAPQITEDFIPDEKKGKKDKKDPDKDPEPEPQPEEKFDFFQEDVDPPAGDPEPEPTPDATPTIPEDADTYFNDLYADLKDKGIIKNVELEDGEVLTADRLLEIQEEEFNIEVQNRVDSFAENIIGQDGVDLMKFLRDGGNIKDYVTAMKNSPDMPTGSIEDESYQEQVVTSQLRVEGWSDEDIQDQIEYLASSGTLKKRASFFEKNLKEKIQKNKEKMLQAQETKRLAAEQKRNEFEGNLKDTLSTKNDFFGFRVTPAKQSTILKNITTPTITLEDGNQITKLQDDLAKAFNDPEKLVALSIVLDNNFDFSSLERKIASQKAKDVKKNIENRRPNPRSVTGSSNIGGSLADMFDFKK